MTLSRVIMAEYVYAMTETLQASTCANAGRATSGPTARKVRQNLQLMSIKYLYRPFVYLYWCIFINTSILIKYLPWIPYSIYFVSWHFDYGKAGYMQAVDHKKVCVIKNKPCRITGHTLWFFESQYIDFKNVYDLESLGPTYFVIHQPRGTSSTLLRCRWIR